MTGFYKHKHCNGIKLNIPYNTLQHNFVISTFCQSSQKACIVSQRQRSTVIENSLVDKPVVTVRKKCDSSQPESSPCLATAALRGLRSASEIFILIYDYLFC